MNLSFSIATPADAIPLAALHTSVAEDLYFELVVL
jgi:hypothetical protein